MHKVLVLEAYWKFPRFPLLAKFGASSKDLRLVPNRQKPVAPFIAERLTYKPIFSIAHAERKGKGRKVSPQVVEI